MRIAFCHPDLGLGGAERLVVDAAQELAVNHNHEVIIYTAYYDKNRCFEETKTGKFKVVVAGGWFPRQILGKFTALCAIIRCILIAFYVIFSEQFYNRKNFDVIFVDQVSAVVPFFVFFTTMKVFFYCHFPDLLLARPNSVLHKIYRIPLNFLEQITTGMADILLVNSKFTAKIFAETFQILNYLQIIPNVLYPAVPIKSGKELEYYEKNWLKLMKENPRMGNEFANFVENRTVFLSINRFERKKGIDLAPKALKILNDQLNDESKAVLILAGGYDVRIKENVGHLEELREIVEKSKLDKYVRFYPSFTDEEREVLFAACKVVIYTPQNEHFGIVPIEAMAHKKPVIAVESGGPIESVWDSGFLVQPTPEEFAKAMQQLLDENKQQYFGKKAGERVELKFSRKQFGIRLNDLMIKSVTKSKQTTVSAFQVVCSGLFLVIAFLFVWLFILSVILQAVAK